MQQQCSVHVLSCVDSVLRIASYQAFLALHQCGMCHGTSGAFRKTVDGKWVHAFCAEWLLDTKYVRGQDKPVEGTETLVEGKDTCVCLHNVGGCLRCSSGDCNITFHPTCARSCGFYMNTKGFGTTPQHKAYCGKHSVQQKEADAQQYGPEELTSMKRMRISMPDLHYIVSLCLVA
uniref:PHD-type domain-containing protein n=1 Tax=Zea mays TaxID=4577 RepID=A0A804PTS4_MAIZE